jgi:ribose-phosphate pyrophosphokinase
MISGLISSPKFGDVQILDPHTYATYSLIPNSRPMLKENLRVPYNNIGPSAVIFPDAHAMDHGVTWHAKEGFTFDKQRHSDRSVTLVGPGVKFDHIHCFVVDDICDGGATFIELAKHLSNPASLTLCVTHGIFSKGVERLFDAGYTKIITTNSYCEIVNDPRVEIIDVLQ